MIPSPSHRLSSCCSRARGRTDAHADHRRPPRGRRRRAGPVRGRARRPRPPRSPAPGCLDLAVTADALDLTRVNNFERWQSVEHLDAWRAVAHAPDTGITVRSADVMMNVVSDVRPPFG